MQQLTKSKKLGFHPTFEKLFAVPLASHQTSSKNTFNNDSKSLKI